MSEELLQRDLLNNPEKIGKWDYYNIGATTVKSLKEHGIIRNVDYGDVEKKKVDALIVLNKNVLAVIEYKKPSEFKTNEQKNKAINQELEVARKLGASIIIATDTIDTIWVNVNTGNRIRTENGTELIAKFDPKDENLALFIEKVKASINEINDQIKPKELVNPTGLAKQIWQDIWSVSGATPENCLYTFVELFIFKYLSDLEVLKEPENFDFLMKLYEKRDANDVLEYYATSIRPKIKRDLFPQGNDGTTIINGTIFVSKDQKAVAGYSNVFKKVLFKFQDYGKLENIDYDFKSQLFESFLKESISKKNWGQFFTPLKVVRAITEMAKDEIKPGVKICDPACGVGKFLLEPVITKINDFYEIKNNKLIPKITIHGYDKGFDKDEQRTIILAKANMLIYFSDLIRENPTLTKEFAGLFNDSFELKTNSILGTLSDTPRDEYDLILTNPPYVTSGSSNLKDEIKKDGDLMNYYKVNAIGVEGLFMEWIIRALKPNGKAFIVVPDGIFNRQNDKNLRQFIIDECYIDGIISLPLKTFFTTPKKTYILCITKKSNKKDVQLDPVFTYLVSEIGETRDVYRFDIEQNDLQEAVVLHSFFKGNKKGFEKINTDKRCKVVPFEKFQPDAHWSIERWWTKDEQIELGIKDEDNIVSLTSFGEMINDVSNTLSEFSETLKEVGEKKNSITEFRDIKLSDTDFFDLFIGKRVLKKEIVTNLTGIPVYSANVKNSIGYHTKSFLQDFSKDFVIWGIDGDFEFNFIPKNIEFYPTDHCGVIKIKNDDILPEFLMLQLEKAKHLYGFDRGLRSSLKNMKEVSVQLPFTKNGEIDNTIQKEVVEKYQLTKEIKDKITYHKDLIKKVSVEFSKNDSIKTFKVKDIFNIERGDGRYIKKYIDVNKGGFPVYSGNAFSVFAYINQYDYELPCISWVIDGLAGYIMVHNEKFSATNHRGMLIPKDKDSIDLNYVKFVLEPLFRNAKKGRIGSGGENEYTALPPFMVEEIEFDLPVDMNGKIDIKKQKEISEKYTKIEEVKNSLVNELDKVANVTVDFN